MKRVEVMMKKTICALVALTLVGCSGMTQPDKDQQTIALAGDAGAIACLAASMKLKDKGDLEKVKISVAAAYDVLLSPTPDVSALQKALEQGLSSDDARIVAVVFSRLRVRLGSTNILAKDSLEYGIAEAFLSACSLSL